MQAGDPLPTCGLRTGVPKTVACGVKPEARGSGGQSEGLGHRQKEFQAGFLRKKRHEAKIKNSGEVGVAGAGGTGRVSGRRPGWSPL